MSEKAEFLQEYLAAAKPIADFLEEQLSMTDANWWEHKILPYVFNDSDKANLQYRKLEKLDTSVLLIIYQNNLKEICDNTGIYHLDRQLLKNYLFECQSARNKYAHHQWNAEASAYDLARDFDTLYRICESVNADSKTLNNLSDCRLYYMQKAYGMETRSEPKAEAPKAPEVKPVQVVEEPVAEPAAPYFMPQMQPAPVFFMGVQPSMMYGMMMNSFGMRQ